MNYSFLTNQEFSDLRARMAEAIERMVKKHALAVEQLTEAQLAEAIRQAIECGDFQVNRMVSLDSLQHAEVVTYLPYAKEQELQAEINRLREVLRRISDMECSEYDHKWTGCCLDDAKEIVEQALAFKNKV